MSWFVCYVYILMHSGVILTRDSMLTGHTVAHYVYHAFKHKLAL